MSEGKTSLEQDLEKPQQPQPPLENVPAEQSTSQQPQRPEEAGPSSDQSPPSQPEDRVELLARARSFLTSPQVQYQDLAAKRTFLREKGLHEYDIDDLLRNLPHQLPAIPPRTYPQPPPSNLPVLLLGLARLFSWLAGGSAALLFIYHRLLLPRITQTALARHSLKSHHLSLMRHLTTSLSSLKESQSESFSVLPRPNLSQELKPFSECRSVGDVLQKLGEKNPDYSKIPPVTLLRCGIEDFGKGKEETAAKPTTEDLFRFLEGQIPWLVSEEGYHFEQELWDTLSTSSLFNKFIPSFSSSNPVQENTELAAKWEYCAPPTPTTPPLLKSLESLSSALPKDAKNRKSPFQYTLQSLSDFTGYISTQVYMPYRPPPVGMGIPSSNAPNSVEDEFRREIRALKGLVLNRRSFMPTIPRPPSSFASTSARTAT